MHRQFRYLVRHGLKYANMQFRITYAKCDFHGAFDGVMELSLKYLFSKIVAIVLWFIAIHFLSSK